MIELIQQRNYNSKHFLHPTETGKKILEAHAGHIHYLKDGNFEPLDWKLLWDNIRRGWYFETHSYNPFLPEYSDGWAEFRDRFHDKDQTVRYKAIVQNIVKGELIETDETNPNFDDNIDNKGVLYRNAFGENRDYMLYNTRSSLVKVATVNNPNECTADAVFEWEVEFPDKELFRVDKKEDAEDMTRLATKTNTEDGKLVGYKLEKRDGKNLNTNKLTLIGNSKLDGKEWYTYLKSFKAWDSAGNTIEIVARISFVNDKAILKKTIPLEFLKNAVGRVFTDTTTSYYSHSSDADITNQSASWATAHDATSGTGGVRTGTDTYFQCRKLGADYIIARIFMPFDTSGIGDTDTIDSATLNIRAFNITGTDSTIYLNVYASTQASDTELVAGDFDQTGTTAYATKLQVNGMSTSAYTTFTFNSSGLAAISKTGYTKLALKDSDYDNANTAVTTGLYSGYRTSEYTGTSQDPYLSVTYSAGGGSTFVPKIIMF